MNEAVTAPLEIEGLTFRYHSRTEPALKDISFSLNPGEILLLAGASGCGKTTLMRCINGLISGFVGNLLSELISSYGFWPWWDLGNGLMGFVPGLIYLTIVDFRSLGDLNKAEIMVVVGAAVGMFVASVSEIWVSGIDFATEMATNFVPVFVSNVVNGLILVPILMIAYAAVRGRSGR